TISVVEAKRVITGVVAEPAFPDDGKPLAINAERRRTVADDLTPGDGLQHSAGTEKVVSELSARERHRKDVAVAVARDLVSGCGDFSDEIWLTLRHPAEDEERRVNPVLGQKAKNDAGPPGHAARHRLPALRRKRRPEILHLKPILDIEREQAGDHSRR